MQKSIVIIFEEIIHSGLTTLASELTKTLVKQKYKIFIVCEDNNLSILYSYLGMLPSAQIYTYKVVSRKKLFIPLERVVKTWM